MRKRLGSGQERSEQAIAAIIAERSGRDASDLDVKCAAAAVIAVFTTLVRHWIEGGGTENLAELYARHLPLPEHGLEF